MTDKNKTQKIKDDEVMITSSISDLEKMLEEVEKHNRSKFEKFFLPSLLVFTLLAFGGFWIIYSITIDMNKLAKAMDPQMGKNMSAMVKSVDSLAKSVTQMNISVAKIEHNFASVNHNMEVVANKLDNLDEISIYTGQINQRIGTLKPMLKNMEEMNSNMVGMRRSMLWMQRDISTLRASFSKPMSVFNAIPFL